MSQPLPESFTRLVNRAIACLGQAIRDEAGEDLFEQVESFRLRLKSMRSAEHQAIVDDLNRLSDLLEGLPAEQQLAIAHSYALMLELINCCENAYRTHRLRQRDTPQGPSGTESILYVLTAHPTEARATECVALFRQIQDRLIEALQLGLHNLEWDLLPLLKLAWKIPMAKRSRPTVQGEADHLYGIVLRPEALRALLQGHFEGTPLYLRSWVGGDKDGHPGVDEQTLVDSMQLSRGYLLRALSDRFGAIRENLHLLQASDQAQEAAALTHKLNELCSMLGPLESVRERDGQRIRALRVELREFRRRYDSLVGSPTRGSAEIRILLHVFPALVLPLELREGADLIEQATQEGGLAIERMLLKLREVSDGANPHWYVRGLIISMVATSQDLTNAGELVVRTLGDLKIAVVPLLEQEAAIRDATTILGEALDRAPFKDVFEERWSRRVEVMLGYSDSAKEIGALPSRVVISKALAEMDAFFAQRRLTPVFFHGSGGSVARGGGSIQEQISWWPTSALNLFKVTVQGEMVQRSFASGEIATSQLRKIGRISHELKQSPPRKANISPEVLTFARFVRDAYQEKFRSDEFLDVIQRATPYAYLSELKLGSRPSKRKGAFSLDTIRAIPWVLCWTQTRVLFPTWWGVGSAWHESTAADQAALKQAFNDDPLFRSFVKMLGFTLAKVELPVWDFLLSRSTLSEEVKHSTSKSFRDEFNLAVTFVRSVSDQQELLWFRPWLGESIRLRSSMIHVLNLTQQIAVKNEDQTLLRESVTGIACGMLTTG